MKKRTLALMLSAALCVGMLAGCGGGTQGNTDSPAGDSNSPAAESPANETQEISGTVNTDGSTSMADVMAAFTESFGNMYPDVTVNYSGTGSGSGITNVLAGSVDIGLSSRALKADETGVTGTTVALDGIAIIINADSKVADLTVAQIADIFTGKITDWSEVAATPAPSPASAVSPAAAPGTVSSPSPIPRMPASWTRS